MRYIALFTLFFHLSLSAQYVTTYKDIMDLVHVFDDGYSSILEPLPLVSYKVGKTAMLYVNSQGRLKAYYKGKTTTLIDNAPDYFVTDNFVGYYNLGNIAVLNNNKFQSLDGLSLPIYWVSDSLIVWGSNLSDTRVFYEGNSYDIEQWAISDTTIKYGDKFAYEFAKISDNIFAYIDRADNFKVFYHGAQGLLEGYRPESFRVDREYSIYR